VCKKEKEDLKMDDFELYDGDFDYEDGEYLDGDDYDWGYNEDEGFDPYAGCYTWDC
jgi:hypothetical protein